MELEPPEPQNTPKAEFDEAKGAPVAFGALLFGFGVVAGVLVAFSGYGLMQDSAGLIVTVFLSAIFIISLLGGLLMLFRRPLLRRVFGVADTQLQRFAEPLAEVAEGAAERNPLRATSAARDLVRLSLARYAWLSTRRWVIASLTGLIAAMAALAGTALLFKQNELLAMQMELMREQNQKLDAQTNFLSQDVQLAEAARNAELAVEITRIADLLGAAMQKAGQGKAAGANAEAWVPSLNPYRDLSPDVVMRITSASRAVKPYRFLDPQIRAHDPADKLRVAMEGRRQELPQSYAAMQGWFDWTDPPPDDRLIDRPASPERAQLLQTMVRAGLRDYELLNWFGLDLSFAYGQDTDLMGLSMQGAQLSFAQLDRAQILECDFRGGALENISFRKARLRDVQFAALPASQAKPPFAAEDGLYGTALAGANFSGAYLDQVQFMQAQGGAMVFDGATLNGVDFTGASLGASSFRKAVLLDVKFDGTDMRSVDLDGALVFSADALNRIAAGAAEGTFRADRFVQEPTDMTALEDIHSAFLNLTEDMIAEKNGGTGVWRLRRVKPFEE